MSDLGITSVRNVKAVVDALERDKAIYIIPGENKKKHMYPGELPAVLDPAPTLPAIES
jgi:hypothetical protein